MASDAMPIEWITDVEWYFAMALMTYLQHKGAAEYNVMEGILSMMNSNSANFMSRLMTHCDKRMADCDSDLNTDLHVLAACVGHVSASIMALGADWQNHVIHRWFVAHGGFDGKTCSSTVKETRRLADRMPGDADHNRVRELDGKPPVTPHQVLVAYRRRCLFAGVMLEFAQDPRIKKSWSEEDVFPPAEWLGADRNPERLAWRRALTLKGACALIRDRSFPVPKQINGVEL